MNYILSLIKTAFGVSMFKKTIIGTLRRIKYKKINTKIFTSNIGNNFSCGAYCLIGKNAFISDNVKIGNLSYINSSIGQVIIESNFNIGSFCSIASNVIIAPGNHYTSFVTTHPLLYDIYYSQLMGLDVTLECNGLIDKDVQTNIGNDVWIGMNSIIKRGVTIGDGAIVGAGSVVTKNVAPYSIVGGVPANLIKFRFDQEQLDALAKCKTIWQLSPTELAENFSSLYDITEYIKNLKNN